MFRDQVNEYVRIKYYRRGITVLPTVLPTAKNGVGEPSSKFEWVSLFSSHNDGLHIVTNPFFFPIAGKISFIGNKSRKKAILDFKKEFCGYQLHPIKNAYSWHRRDRFYGPQRVYRMYFISTYILTYICVYVCEYSYTHTHAYIYTWTNYILGLYIYIYIYITTTPHEQDVTQGPFLSAI